VNVGVVRGCSVLIYRCLDKQMVRSAIETTDECCADEVIAYSVWCELPEFLTQSPPMRPACANDFNMRSDSRRGR